MCWEDLLRQKRFWHVRSLVRRNVFRHKRNLILRNRISWNATHAVRHKRSLALRNCKRWNTGHAAIYRLSVWEVCRTLITRRNGFSIEIWMRFMFRPRTGAKMLIKPTVNCRLPHARVQIVHWLFSVRVVRKVLRHRCVRRDARELLVAVHRFVLMQMCFTLMKCFPKLSAAWLSMSIPSFPQSRPCPWIPSACPRVD